MSDQIIIKPSYQATITRGTPIEKQPDPDLISGDLFFALTDKINEIIDCINAMNVVSGDSDTGDTKP